jgi:ADP-ribosyl-[dinitrogen reductase] hydrolase
MRDERRGRDRVVGAMIGLAVGDALGVPVEFEPRASREADPVRDMRGGGTWKLPPGAWSDDTSLALCLAQSIALRGFDPEDSGRRSLAWMDEGLWAAQGKAFDIGGATRRALDRIRAGMPAVLAGGRGENDNGNGSLMRIMPAAMWLASAPEPARLRAIASYSAATHGHPRSILGCWLLSLVASRLMGGLGTAEAYEAAMQEARACLSGLPASLKAETGAYARVLDGSLAKAPAASIRGSGYVVHCLEASLWCLLSTKDFRSCVLSAVNLGEDADTTGAVAGALAGLAYGREGIPDEWATTIARAQEIETLAERLSILAYPPSPPEGCYWVLPGKLLAGPYPGRKAGASPSLASLLDSGVDAFIDLSAEGEDAGAEAYSVREGIEHRRAPMADMSADEVAVKRALVEIEAALASGKTAYVHCVGGMGRTGAVVGAFLADTGLAAPGEGLLLLGSLRKLAALKPELSPQTEAQRALVALTRPGPFALPL